MDSNFLKKIIQSVNYNARYKRAAVEIKYGLAEGIANKFIMNEEFHDMIMLLLTKEFGIKGQIFRVRFT